MSNYILNIKYQFDFDNYLLGCIIIISAMIGPLRRSAIKVFYAFGIILFPFTFDFILT